MWPRDPQLLGHCLFWLTNLLLTKHCNCLLVRAKIGLSVLFLTMISCMLHQCTFGCICSQKIPRLLNTEKEELFQPPWLSYDTFTITSLNHCMCILITLSSAELVISFNTHPPKHNHKVSWWTYQSGTENGTNSGQLPEPWTWLWGERFLQIGQQSIEPLPLNTAIWGL